VPEVRFVLGSGPRDWNVGYYDPTYPGHVVLVPHQTKEVARTTAFSLATAAPDAQFEISQGKEPDMWETVTELTDEWAPPAGRYEIRCAPWHPISASNSLVEAITRIRWLSLLTGDPDWLLYNVEAEAYIKPFAPGDFKAWRESKWFEHNRAKIAVIEE